jgi:phosphoribosylamine--glycine ligase
MTCLESGSQVVIEEYLDGPEVSLFAITDGTTVIPLVPVQDFKRVGDGDTGPNTGGMGAYAPLPWAPAGLVDEVMANVLQPTVDVMRERGTPFSGLLYAGLALTSRGMRVIEFNARFGDPETQVLIPRLQTPLAHLLYKAATDDLDDVALQWLDDSAVTVVLAAPGYPADPVSGGEITNLPNVADTQIFHAGTKSEGKKLLANGGRVLTVTGIGSNLTEARNQAYRAISQINLTNSFYRSDIALNASMAEKGN